MAPPKVGIVCPHRVSCAKATPRTNHKLEAIFGGSIIAARRSHLCSWNNVSDEAGSFWWFTGLMAAQSSDERAAQDRKFVAGPSVVKLPGCSDDGQSGRIRTSEPECGGFKCNEESSQEHAQTGPAAHLGGVESRCLSLLFQNCYANVALIFARSHANLFSNSSYVKI
jgi:hypothetical protein